MVDPMLTFRRPTAEDIADLAAHMRDADVDEVLAASGDNPTVALERAVAASSECCVARLSTGVLCIWGVVPMPPATALGPRVGAVWMLTSDLVDLCPLVFWRGCKTVIRDLVSRWDLLCNAIDCRHEKALRWAARLGLRLGDPEVWGHARLPFRLFALKRENLRV